MVCITCIVVPFLLFIWHRFLYPIFTMFWNPFGRGKGVEATKDGIKGVTDNATDAEEKSDQSTTKENGTKCPFSTSDENLTTSEGEIDSQETKKTNLEDDLQPGESMTSCTDEEPREDCQAIGKEMRKSDGFSDTLEGFGYKFEDGRLRQISTGDSFNFVVKDDQSYNQKRYEALDAVVTKLYNLLEVRSGLLRLTVPVDSKKSEASTSIFASEDYAAKDKQLFIHGSGRVRAGQWAQSLEDDLQPGESMTSCTDEEPREDCQVVGKEMRKSDGFPDTLEGFGYKFEDGRLRQISTGDSFNFVVKHDQSYNQKHYEALGAVVTEEVYNLLEERCGLQRLTVPVDSKKSEASTFIFASEDYAAKDKLLVIIHGSGDVRAGQWAQSLIINECLDSGTQIPFIERGLKEGYGILLMNTNDNTAKVNGKTKLIRGSENPMDHGEYVWKHFVKTSQSSKIFIVAHSFGGIVTTKTFLKYKKDFVNRVTAVAMTDSVHCISDPLQFKPLIEISCNWVSSDEPLDTLISRRSQDVQCVSAGCIKPEMTSWSSFDSVFKFFDKRLAIVEAFEPELKSACSRESKKPKLDDELDRPKSKRPLSSDHEKAEDDQLPSYMDHVAATTLGHDSTSDLHPKTNGVRDLEEPSNAVSPSESQMTQDVKESLINEDEEIAAMLGQEEFDSQISFMEDEQERTTQLSPTERSSNTQEKL